MNVVIKNVLPQAARILISDEKYRRVQWAKTHKNCNFTSTICTDET